jgi:glutamate-1-semialdehyde aminotransferase
VTTTGNARRAEGAPLEDVDGTRDIDDHAAFGPLIYSHTDADIDRTLQASEDALRVVLAHRRRA